MQISLHLFLKRNKLLLGRIFRLTAEVQIQPLYDFFFFKYVNAAQQMLKHRPTKTGFFFALYVRFQHS